MKNILLVEDQSDKYIQLAEFILNCFPSGVNIVHRKSLRGALKELVTNENYDLILLDMSMPNYDPSDDYTIDNSTESFAGKELIEQLGLRNIRIPVIVITQYSSFEGGQVTLKSLSDDLTMEYGSFYLGSVYYNSAVEDWKQDLLLLLKGIK